MKTTINTNNTKIGFIGLGIMGAPMAGHLLKAGYQLTVYNRTQSKADNLVAAGAQRASSPVEAAHNADFLIIIVSDSPQVESVLFAEHGAVTALKANSIVIDMSTISATRTREFADKLAARQVHMLDAPVSGGDIGAINAALTIMVGGEEAIFERAKPLFDVLGSSATLVGPTGSGQVTKSCNQILVVNALIGVCEALALAEAQGLNLNKVLGSVANGAAASFQLSNLGPKMITEDLQPGFMIELMYKDLLIVRQVAESSGLSLRATELVFDYFADLMQSGCQKLGTQALFKVYQR